MTNGTVKFYNDQKGFGFIQPDNGEKDVFVHATALERAGIQGLREGQKDEVRHPERSAQRQGRGRRHRTDLTSSPHLRTLRATAASGGSQPKEVAIMRIFIFKSQANSALRAFAGEAGRSEAAVQVRALARDRRDPRRQGAAVQNVSRDVIEKAIAGQGYQLFKMKPKAAAAG